MERSLLPLQTLKTIHLLQLLPVAIPLLHLLPVAKTRIQKIFLSTNTRRTVTRTITIIVPGPLFARNYHPDITSRGTTAADKLVLVVHMMMVLLGGVLLRMIVLLLLLLPTIVILLLSMMIVVVIPTMTIVVIVPMMPVLVLPMKRIVLVIPTMTIVAATPKKIVAALTMSITRHIAIMLRLSMDILAGADYRIPYLFPAIIPLLPLCFLLIPNAVSFLIIFYSSHYFVRANYYFQKIT
jgi:hypothetical protein